MLHDFRHWEKWGFAAVLVVGLIVWAVEKYRDKKIRTFDARI